MFLKKKKTKLKAEALYDEYKDLIYSIAYDMSEDYHAAEDITQGTMEKIIKYPKTISTLSGNELKNYIARIAINETIDFLNESERNKVSFFPEENISENEIADDFDLEEFIVTNETKEELDEAVRRMDSRYSDPLVLKKLYGHTESEIAALLNIPEWTVKYRIKKATEILRKEVFKRGEEDGR